MGGGGLWGIYALTCVFSPAAQVGCVLGCEASIRGPFATTLMQKTVSACSCMGGASHNPLLLSLLPSLFEVLGQYFYRVP
jgi:hypothetical protein